jgi:hypothetical protein
MIKSKFESTDPDTEKAIGCAQPLEEHWNDPLWQGLVAKHLLKSPAHSSAKNIPANPSNPFILSSCQKIVF